MDQQNKEIESEEYSKKRILPKYLSWLVMALGVCMSIFHMYTGYYGPYEFFVQRGLHLAFPVFIGFLLYCVPR